MTKLTIRQAEERTGVNNRTIRNYIKSGKIQATLAPKGEAEQYVIDESELVKLPKPYKKHGVVKSEVPQGTHPTIAIAPRTLTVAWGTPEEIIAYERLRLQLVPA